MVCSLSLFFYLAGDVLYFSVGMYSICSEALGVQIYLKINRVDLAIKEIASIKTWADDASLAQMIEAWANLYVVSNLYSEYNLWWWDVAMIGNTIILGVVDSFLPLQ